MQVDDVDSGVGVAADGAFGHGAGFVRGVVEHLNFEQIADFCGLHKLEIQAIADGEVAIGITFARFVLTYNKQGANLDYIRDYNMLGDGQYINIAAKAPRPNAGKAFIDFFLDEESMKIQADTGEFVNRKGVYPPLQDADKIKFVQMYQFTKEDYETKKKEYQKIFMQ